VGPITFSLVALDAVMLTRRLRTPGLRDNLFLR
jgi:hypothetical protein